VKRVGAGLLTKTGISNDLAASETFVTPARRTPCSLGYEPKELFTALTLPLEVHFNSIDFAASMEAD
jgi:hypothetical protein